MIKTDRAFSPINFIRELEDAGLDRKVAEILARYQENCMVSKADLDRAVADIGHKIEITKRDIIIALGGLIVVGTSALAILVKLQ